MRFPVLRSLLHILDLVPPTFRSLGGHVGDVHLVDFGVAAEEGEGVGEEHVVGGQEVAVGGGGEEVGEPDGDDEGDENGLGVLSMEFAREYGLGWSY